MISVCINHKLRCRPCDYNIHVVVNAGGTTIEPSNGEVCRIHGGWLEE